MCELSGIDGCCFFSLFVLSLLFKMKTSVERKRRHNYFYSPEPILSRCQIMGKECLDKREKSLDYKLKPNH